MNYPAYDADGNLLARVDGNSAVTEYYYDDPDSKLTTVAYPADTITNVTNGYDAFGRLASTSDGAYIKVDSTPGEVFTYDDLDNILTKTVNYSSTQTALQGLELSYAYNADGSRYSMTVPTYSESGTVPGTFDYTYDDDARLVGITNPSGGTFGWSYDDNSWLASQSSTDAASSMLLDTTYTYDARGELTDLRNYENGLSSMWSVFGGDGVGSDPDPMTYDASGNRLTMPATESYGTYSGDVTYTYDYKNELASEASTRNGGSGDAVDNTFDYDGNFTELRGTSVDTANDDDQLTASGYTYDGNGNPTTYAGNTLTYDPENRLASITISDITTMQATYGYDGLRVSRTNGSDTQVFYLYDGMEPVVQFSSAGVVNVVATFGANGLMSRYSQNFNSGYKERFYAFDPQGNCAEMIDDACGVQGN